MNAALAIGASDVLLVIDLQNDFCPGGALAVPGGHDVVPLINRLSRHFRHAVLTQDWHPPGHASFASSHPGRQVFETVAFDYGPQVLWPDHCVQLSPGALLHSGLDIPNAELIVRKGYHPGIDSYSAFFENDRKTPTGLGGYLRERGFSRVFVAGLALDFCVRYSAEDAARIGLGAVVIEDACRAIDMGGSAAAAHEALAKAGVACVESAAIIGSLELAPQFRTVG